MGEEQGGFQEVLVSRIPQRNLGEQTGHLISVVIEVVVVSVKSRWLKSILSNEKNTYLSALTSRGEHCITSRIVDFLCCAPETNRTCVSTIVQ